MEIKVGAKFNKVGTDEIVTVTKYDSERGTVIVKFPSGRSIPMSTGSLMKADKWTYIEDEQEEVAVEEKPKKAKKEKVKKEKKEKVVKEKARKPMARKSNKKIKEEVGEILFGVLRECKSYDMFDRLETKDLSRKENKIIWNLSSATASKIEVVYFTKEKKFEISFTDEIAEMIKGTEFDGLDIMNDEFIEDKLKNFLNVIVEKINEKTESEEKTDGTI